MKRLKLLLVSLSALACLTSCISANTSANNGSVVSYSNNGTGLIVLCTHDLGGAEGWYCRFIRDTYTDNIYMTYFEKHGYGGGGSLSPYYNANGEIMKYEEFKTVHVH